MSMRSHSRMAVPRRRRSASHLAVPCRLPQPRLPLISDKTPGVSHLPTGTEEPPAAVGLETRFGLFASIESFSELAVTGRRQPSWIWNGLGSWGRRRSLIAAHIVSGLSVFPAPLAYVNEAWGGSWNTYKILNDSNVDWGQQLYQVREWEDKHPGEECWLAYMVRPIILPETYGVRCHILPNGTEWLAGFFSGEPVPPVVHGAVMLSASELGGNLWPSRELNPYRALQTRKPDEEIDHGILVYRGDVHLEAAGGVSRAFMA
jgi:hypothetical protein